ncbi:acetyl-CoA decarbonylase/synthase complex subunit delta [Deltaproteobacteria bacterium Smac51]|nr:acetyl-CoA decarbonylase/synthase complex subunit delta [Deltaproteobacteria bacterium Smac51]
MHTVCLGDDRLPIGGQRSLYLHDFEGRNPYPPRFSLDVWDYDPIEDWPEALLTVYQDVRHDTGLWTKKRLDYGADLVTLHLKSTSPNNQDLGADQAVKSVRRVLEEINAPLIVMGVDHTNKDVETLSAVAEEFSGRNLALGPVTSRNYKRLGAQAIAHGHSVIALSPTDFNLAKQLNILLYGMGMPKDRIIMDPTAAALGYGMEYCYTVMEQLQIAALVVDDQDAQHPMISFFGEDVWKTKEAARMIDTSNRSGEKISQGITLEATEAITMILAGASILSMRHPKALKTAKSFLRQFNDF